MKKYYLILVLVIAGLQLFSQQVIPPAAFNYQAIVRDNAGNTVNNQLVSLRLSILQGSAFGAASYVETQQTTTNEFGLVNLGIGNGTVVLGTIKSIDWSLSAYYLKVEIDITGGKPIHLWETRVNC